MLKGSAGETLIRGVVELGGNLVRGVEWGEYRKTKCCAHRQGKNISSKALKATS